MIMYFLFIAHCLADFTFQSAEFSKKKLKNFTYLLYHTLVYAVIFFLAIFPFVKLKTAVFPYVIITVSHFIIDSLRRLVDRKFSSEAIMFTSFIMDQIFHFSILAVLYYAFNLGGETTRLYGFIHQWPYLNNLVVYCLVFVILWDAAAIFVKKLLTYVIGENSYEQENDPQVGRIIGKLERLIISVLVLSNQFGAIGFVLTAKSIARYKQLEDKNFAERYLVGTLTSVSIALATTIILKQFLKQHP